MTSQTHTLNTRPKHSIARFFGVLFIFSALIASALTVILPHGSSAASSAITLTPDADTYVRQSTPGSAYATSSQIFHRRRQRYAHRVPALYRGGHPEWCRHPIRQVAPGRHQRLNQRRHCHGHDQCKLAGECNLERPAGG